MQRKIRLTQVILSLHLDPVLDAGRTKAPQDMRRDEVTNHVEPELPRRRLLDPELQAIKGGGIDGGCVQHESEGANGPPVGFPPHRLVGHQLIHNVRTTHRQIVVIDDGGLSGVLGTAEDGVDRCHDEDVVQRA